MYLLILVVVVVVAVQFYSTRSHNAANVLHRQLYSKYKCLQSVISEVAQCSVVRQYYGWGIGMPL